MKLLLSVAALLVVASATAEPDYGYGGYGGGHGHCKGKHCPKPSKTHKTKTKTTAKPSITAECGNRAFPPCPETATCVALPGRSCGPEADCGGYCSPLPSTTSTYVPNPDPTPADPIRCGGFVPDDQRVYCPQGQICQIEPSSPCFGGQAVDCTGQCVGQPCGGFTFPLQPPCPKGQVCVRRPDQPRFDEVPDLSGICVFEDATCGGFTGISKCPPNWDCVDDPRDSCDPRNGGADCGGVCAFNRTVTSGDAGGDPRRM